MGSERAVEAAAILGEFAAQVSEGLVAGGPEGLFAAQGPLGLLAVSGWATERVGLLLEEVGRQPGRPVPGTVDGGFLVGQGAGWSLTLRLRPMPYPPGLLVSAAAHCLIAPLGAGPAHVEVFARPSHERADALDGKALAPTGTHTVDRGQVLALHAEQHLGVFTQPDTASPHLLLTSGPVLAYRFAYDRATLRAVQVISADLRATRVTYALRLLGAAGSATSVPRLQELTDHPQHQVRWEAIRALFRIDRAAGLARLRQAAIHDPHPEVRATAASALDAVPAAAPRLVGTT